MDSAQRNTESPVVQSLFEHPETYRFFTAIRLFERVIGSSVKVGRGGSPSEEPVYCVPDPSISFPRTDVVGAEWTDSKRQQVKVVATFLGLYGVHSPLPTYFQEGALENRPGAKPIRAFLDLFNHRLYAFFYRAWLRNQMHDLIQGESRSREEAMLACLTGIGSNRTVPPKLSARRLFASAGLLGSKPKSARGLERVVHEYFRVPARITENVQRWQPNPAPTRLGGITGRLGHSLALGERIREATTTFRVGLGPLTEDQPRRFLPGSEGHAAVCNLVRMYAPDQLDFDLELVLPAAGAESVKLGTAQAPLGYLSWIGRPTSSMVRVPVGSART